MSANEEAVTEFVKSVRLNTVNWEKIGNFVRFN